MYADRAGLGDYYYDDPLSSGGGGYYPGSGGYSYTPGSTYPGGGGTTTSALSWGGVWDTIQDVAGDVAGDLKEQVATWLKERIGRELWERAPEETRQEYVRRAISDVAGTTSARWLPWLLLGGAVALPRLLGR